LGKTKEEDNKPQRERPEAGKLEGEEEGSKGTGKTMFKSGKKKKSAVPDRIRRTAYEEVRW